MSNEIDKDIPPPEGMMGRPTAYGAVEGKEKPEAEEEKKKEPTPDENVPKKDFEPVAQPSAQEQDSVLRLKIERLEHRLEIERLKRELAEAKAGDKDKPSAKDKQVETPIAGKPMPKEEDIPEGAPPMPEMDPQGGDKTPAVVEWFKKHWPEEYEKRYKLRKTHLKATRISEDRPPEEEDRPKAKKEKDFEESKDTAGMDLSARVYSKP